MTIEKLEGRALDARCAELAGWAGGSWRCPHYSTDIRAARELLAVVERDGKQEEFLEYLYNETESEWAWSVLTATPEQMARAFVATMGCDPDTVRQTAVAVSPVSD